MESCVNANNGRLLIITASAWTAVDAACLLHLHQQQQQQQQQPEHSSLAF